MGRALYATWTDNVAPNATVVAVGTGTVDPAYPATNINNQVLALPAKLLTTTGSWTFTFAAQQRVDLVAIPHHNLTAGLEVRIQGNATDSWGSPSLNTTITIPAYRGDGFPPGAWKDLTGVSGYTTNGYQYWRLIVVGVNAANVAISELYLVAQKRTLNPNINWGVQFNESRPIIENRSDFGVATIYDLGVTFRKITGDVDTNDAGLAALRTLYQDCRGRARQFCLIPDESLNDAWIVRWSAGLDMTLVQIDRNTIPLAFDEVSRGLVL
jgi:hypothetical protein